MHWRSYFIRFIWFCKGEQSYKKFKQLKKEELLPRNKIEELQLSRLKEFVEHCYRNVPYYTELFNSINLKPEDIKSIEDLKKIPVLTKQIARENSDKLIDVNSLNKKKAKIRTSGSTGTPFTIYDIRKERNEVLTANLWTFYSRCGWVPGERIATIWGQKHKQNGFLIKIKNFFMGVSYFNAWESNEENFEIWHRQLIRTSTKLLVCYSSVGARFAKWMIENNKKTPLLKGVYTTSEILLDKQREEIQLAFGCNVYDLYGCGEVLAIGCSCSKQKIHINETLNVVEVGESIDNKSAPVILTGFQNRTMPFLRYMNGDSINISEANCKCERESKIMGLSIARVSDTFKFKSGKVVPSLYFILRLYQDGFDGVELFQFHQTELDKIDLKIMKNTKYDKFTLSALNNVINEIEKHLDFEVSVNLMFVEREGFGSSLKHLYAKSDCK